MNNHKFLTSIFLITLTCLIFASTSNILAQSAKDHFKSGIKFKESKNHQDAVKSFTNAIEADPDFTKAYIERAGAYEKLDKYQQAYDDYKRAIAFDLKDKTLCLKAGLSAFQLKNYQEAINMSSKAMELDKKYVEAYQLRARANIKIGKMDNALNDCNSAVDYGKKNGFSYYYRGMIVENLGDNQRAKTNYVKAVEYNKEYEPFHVSLARVLKNLGELDDALRSCNKAISLNPDDAEAFHLRGTVHVAKTNFQNAINDFSKAIFINSNHASAFYERGLVYKSLGQYQNAINDLTKSALINIEDINTYYNRAICYQELGNYPAAIRDYEKIIVLAPDNENAQKLSADARQKIYSINRETSRPEIVLAEPISKEKGKVLIPGNLKYVMLEGKIVDASMIQSVLIGDVEASFDKDILNPSFSAKVYIEKMEQFSITAIDVYNNATTTSYTIERTEVNSPKIKLLAPYASYNGEIYLDTNNPTAYIEGKITDESLIKSVIVEGAYANFAFDKLNPTFSASVDVSNKDAISIKVQDVYGNETAIKYTIKREGLSLASNNPMGKTWAIFIENSNYKNFADLDGPVRDVSLMKSSLSNYRISTIIHKKDLTKTEMERFFSIELRDLVRSNNINSLLIWYSGHGRYINETGYWIPIDAKRNDEFSFYNVNGLKAVLQSYRNLDHTLLVSDACESGPAFYMAMRDLSETKRCDDWQATKFKSSQVFTSTGNEQAADVSLFTHTFARSLTQNPNSCIPIEKIVMKVTESVKQNQKQTPKFGKIRGLDDENGTFFFIKK